MRDPFSRTLVAASLFLGWAVSGPSTTAAAAQTGGTPIDVSAESVLWNPEDFSERQTGKLEFLGGLELTSSDPNFGGLSGLAIDPEGHQLLAVTDAGYWLTATLDAKERLLVGISDVEIAPMRGPDGKLLEGKKETDAEALTLLTPERLMGTLLVAFERKHRIWSYDLGAAGFAATPTAIAPALDGLADWQTNGGIEALTTIRTERDAAALLFVSEDTEDADGNLLGFLVENAKAAKISLKRIGAYQPTDLTTLPDGDIVLLERRYSPIAGAGMQLRRIDRSTIKPGAVLDGEILLDVGIRYSIDNMEGIAARKNAAGETVLYIVSDDNFSPVQRTLLLKFVIRD